MINEQPTDIYVRLMADHVRAYIEFFDKNWLPIKEEWATCHKNEKFTLGELTNNCLESMNGKIKSVCSKFVSLDTFFSKKFNALRGERTHSHIMQHIKVPAMHQPQVTPEDAKYASYVTPYAYTLIVTQLLLRDAVRVPDDGPTTDPWGTPESTGMKFDLSPPTTTACCLFSRKPLIHTLSRPPIP